MLVHIIGVCGTGMAGLAGLLMEKGLEVRGSDQNFYPPMGDYVKDLGIQVRQGYSAENLSPRPDLVIVGNVITRENPEAQALLESNIPYMSFPEALRAFVLKERIPIVVTGTHGKTTTTALIAWILEKAGLDPGYLVGGIPLNLPNSFRLGKGQYFVLEGDEYDTAFFDKRPKFIHYMPQIGVITSIEFDHADIYKDYNSILDSFQSFVNLIPFNGHLVANSDYNDIFKLVEQTACRKYFYSIQDNGHYSISNINYTDNYSLATIRISNKDMLEIKTPIYGLHNMANILASIAVADILGIEKEIVREALLQFRGVKRRQELLGTKGDVTVIDDFAHHPTAVNVTIYAIKERFRPKRLVAIFEPRSNSSRRNVFQRDYVHAFNGADIVIVPEPKNMEKIPLEQRFSSKRLISDLKNMGKEAYYFKGGEEILSFLMNMARPGDLLLFMSNGDFEGLPKRILEVL